jgi:hypothetical protein
MSVTHRLPMDEQLEDAAVDDHAVCIFLRTQASWLLHGLEHADDLPTVRIVLGRHDANHERWLDVIAHRDRSDSETAEQLATLYALQGRIAGCLERGPDPRLGPDIHREVRRMLCERLTAMTAECVEAVGHQRALVGEAASA